jgi:hypothetical protein
LDKASFSGFGGRNLSADGRTFQSRCRAVNSVRKDAPLRKGRL